MRVSRPTTPLDRSTTAKLAAAAAQEWQPAPSRPSVPGAQAALLRTHVGGGMLPPPANTVSLSDGTRISFRAVEELPALIDA